MQARTHKRTRARTHTYTLTHALCFYCLFLNTRSNIACNCIKQRVDANNARMFSCQDDVLTPRCFFVFVFFCQRVSVTFHTAGLYSDSLGQEIAAPKEGMYGQAPD